uniref:Fibronectin type III domain containing 10 n=1 Tax=Equus caballus TaxID=9796 RepID=A0A9L0S5R4_HORSE
AAAGRLRAAALRRGRPDAAGVGAGGRRALVPLQGAARGPRDGRRAPVLPQPRARLPLPGARLRGARLGRPLAARQRPAQPQRAAAVAPGAGRGAPRARLRAQLLVARRLHALPVRARAAGRLLPRLPAARRARRRALPPVPAAAAAARRACRRLPGARRAGRVRGVRRRASWHEGDRGGHDGGRRLHLRHARGHLPARGLHHREPHAPGLRAPRSAQAALKREAARPPGLCLPHEFVGGHRRSSPLSLPRSCSLLGSPRRACWRRIGHRPAAPGP